MTGKPAGDDLREGKETYLVMQARRRADPAGRGLLEGPSATPSWPRTRSPSCAG